MTGGDDVPRFGKERTHQLTLTTEIIIVQMTQLPRDDTVTEELNWIINVGDGRKALPILCQLVRLFLSVQLSRGLQPARSQLLVSGP